MINLSQGQEFDGHYQLIRLIDTGGYAEVWEAKYLVAGNTVALKIYPRLDEDGAATIESEYNKLFELQHSNLVNALHFGRFQNYPYLVMRYYPGGNASGKIGECDEREVANILLQIGGVLKYLHANDLVHQDIKPNNFLLDQKGNYYLADLGLSLKVRTTIRRFTQASSDKPGSLLSSKQTGLTPTQYRAPELFDQQRNHHDPIKATDIWALGASLYEMMTGRAPFGELGGLMQKEGYGIERLPASYSDQLNRLIEDCLAKEAWDRPTASKLEKRAQQYLDNGSWYEPEEWKEKIKEGGDQGSRKTIRRDERDRPGENGEGFDQGGGGFGGGQGGGQGGQGGGGQGEQGGQGQGGAGGGQGDGFGGGGQKKKTGALDESDKKTFRTGLIAVLVAVTLIIVIFVMSSNGHHSSSDASKVVDTSDASKVGVAKDTTYQQKDTTTTVPHLVSGTDGGATGVKDKATGATGTDGGGTGGGGTTGGGTDGGGTTGGGTTASNYLDIKDPVIDDKSEDNCPNKITRIVRNGSVLKVFFFVPGCSGKLSLYGPGDQRAFFVREHGVKNKTYPLISISWTGQEETVPGNGLRISATFRCPPDDVTLLDIREDRGRLDQGLTFMTFNGVHLQ